MQRIGTLLLIYSAVFVAISVAFFVLLRSPLFISQDVLFYRGIELLVVITVLYAVVLAVYWWTKGVVHAESLVAAGIASLAIHVALFVVLPVTFDRSVTMYLLNTLGSAPQTTSCTGYSKDALETNFVEGYVDAQDAVGRRIKEQSIIGLVTPNEQCVELTARGHSFLNFASVVGKIYNLKQ